ncbi:hypothetical protein TraAM80_04536 [Trypanosoma rangeli]|uniref:Uncharacterized protein n=1 Tax=Trypanosoma rangeli TaxID=5698 RepID=A0A3R7MGN4_TRYRA|nr:uncharacterized protein TraAM80_04536 [Trypanosoma rangeli]RNF05496.1 hypothetical protein TraAM80_04536 [Trypanosoma rangeli]|eukprot:RNF05496.1 hypothetical protein TraAM80_04536 [Trypanosoma rangeli]
MSLNDRPWSKQVTRLSKELLQDTLLGGSAAPFHLDARMASIERYRMKKESVAGVESSAPVPSSDPPFPRSGKTNFVSMLYASVSPTQASQSSSPSYSSEGQPPGELDGTCTCVASQ